jgi:putative DNA primase/helicase
MNDQTPGAPAPKESDEECFMRLAKMSRTEFDRCRDVESKRLGIRAATLDAEVAARRLLNRTESALQGRTMRLDDAEPWPEPVIGADLLSDVSEAFSRYVVLPPGAADALALWVAHTHCFESFLCSPRLNIFSPEKGCGKTTLRDVLGLLVPRPLPTENLSVPVLFRVIETFKPTVLADEYDSWLTDNEELRGLFNSGHRRGGQALRCEGDGHEVRRFNVFGPTVLAGIGHLPGTLHDRSIVVRLERARPGEFRRQFDTRRTQQESDLCRKLARWTIDHASELDSHDPVLPCGILNRLADNWRPLFTIAEIAGGNWPGRAAAAFDRLAADSSMDSQGIAIMLLSDLRQILDHAKADRVFSKTLVDSLCALTDRPWPEAHRGRPVTQTWLARRLQSFGIFSRLLRIGGEPSRGYETADFTETFARYLPPKENGGESILA